MRLFKKKQVLSIIISLVILLLIISIILFLYSYLVPFTGLDGSVASLTQSEYFFDSGFFNVNSYNTDNFPVIVRLLSGVRTGLALGLISLAILFDFWLFHFLKKRSGED